MILRYKQIIVAISLLTLNSFAFAFDDNADSRDFARQGGNVPQGDIDLSGFVGTLGNAGFGLGVLGGYRFTRHGFIATLNNSVSGEGGMMLATNCWKHSCYSMSGHVRWDVHVDRMWTPYGAAGITIGTANVFNNDDSTPDIAPDIKLGAFCRLDQEFVLRMELAPFVNSLRFGLTWFI